MQFIKRSRLQMSFFILQMKPFVIKLMQQYSSLNDLDQRFLTFFANAPQIEKFPQELIFVLFNYDFVIQAPFKRT